MKVLHVVGTRPNFMKVAPVLRALDGVAQVAQLLVHTGQHYDPRMSGSFFEDLDLPAPDYFLDVGSGSHAAQTAGMMLKLEPIRYYFLEDLQLQGNAGSSDGAVKFFHTRWCGIRRCDIQEYTKAGAVAVVDSSDHNYFNEIETCHFEDNTTHLKLAGDPSGVGANSNHVFRNQLGNATAPTRWWWTAGTRTESPTTSSATGVAVRFENSAAILNLLKFNQFDGPSKAWEIAGSSVAETRLLYNTGTTALEASTDSGTNTVRRDHRTELSRVQVYNSAAISETSNAFTTLTFDTERYDPLAMHVATTQYLNCVIAGGHDVLAQVQFHANATGIRMAR